MNITVDNGSSWFVLATDEYNWTYYRKSAVTSIRTMGQDTGNTSLWDVWMTLNGQEIKLNVNPIDKVDIGVVLDTLNEGLDPSSDDTMVVTVGYLFGYDYVREEQ